MPDRGRDRRAALAVGGVGVMLIVAGLAAAPKPGPVFVARPDTEHGVPAWPPRVDRPPTVPAAVSRLADDEPVLGVAVGGHARAYRVGALGRVSRHVVNDVLGDFPVTVTYCDRTGCARVLTGPGAGPLDVAVGGYADGLVLWVDGHLYRQDDLTAAGDDPAPDCPLGDLDFEATTWAAWHRAHPDTDVYVGSD